MVDKELYEKRLNDELILEEVLAGHPKKNEGTPNEFSSENAELTWAQAYLSSKATTKPHVLKKASWDYKEQDL